MRICCSVKYYFNIAVFACTVVQLVPDFTSIGIAHSYRDHHCAPSNGLSLSEWLLTAGVVSAAQGMLLTVFLTLFHADIGRGHRQAFAAACFFVPLQIAMMVWYAVWGTYGIFIVEWYGRRCAGAPLTLMVMACIELVLYFFGAIKVLSGFFSFK